MKRFTVLDKKEGDKFPDARVSMGRLMRGDDNPYGVYIVFISPLKWLRYYHDPSTFDYIYRYCYCKRGLLINIQRRSIQWRKCWVPIQGSS